MREVFLKVPCPATDNTHGERVRTVNFQCLYFHCSFVGMVSFARTKASFFKASFFKASFFVEVNFIVPCCSK
jgi:hypothetical protein